MAGIVLGVPSQVLELNQKGLLERAFHDGLFPNLAYRAEAMPEEWPANTGQQQFMTRPGLLPTVVTPIPVGQDPVPQEVPFEQWIATLNQFTGTIDTHMPTSTTANANLYLRRIHLLGLQAGQSVNQIARNALFQAYLSGSTVCTTVILTTDTTLHVAALNGFTDVVIPSGNVAPQPVSSTYPLSIKLGTGAAQITVIAIGFSPDNGNDPIGPGTIQLSAAVGSAFTARAAVKSIYAPRVVRSAPGDSIDAITAADTLTLQQCINAVAFLRDDNVQPHDDGFFHAHISPLSNAQFFADPVFQRLNQSLPEHVIYKEGFIGHMAGILFYMNTESPKLSNVGTLTSTGTSSVYAQGLGSEIVNGAGVQIGQVLITGRGSVYERYLDESQYVTEAGLLGKNAEFDVVNNGISILTERIRLYLRAPMDRLGQTVSSTWSISTSFPVPSDITAPTSAARYKRAVVLQHAM